MKKQSIKDLVFRVFGLSGSGGYAEDDVVTATPAEDSVVVITGSDGSVTVSFNANNTYNVKYRVMENSDMHRQLLGVFAQMQAGIQVSGSGMFRRTTSGETLQSANVVITRPPDFAAGKGPKVREWSFAFCESTYGTIAGA